MPVLQLLYRMESACFQNQILVFVLEPLVLEPLPAVPVLLAKQDQLLVLAVACRLVYIPPVCRSDRTAAWLLMWSVPKERLFRHFPWQRPQWSVRICVQVEHDCLWAVPLVFGLINSLVIPPVGMPVLPLLFCRHDGKYYPIDSIVLLYICFTQIAT